MKEISAISKLSHKNIVGYKGCWIEAEEPNSDRISKVLKKIQRKERPNGVKEKSFLDIDEKEEEQEDKD